MNRLAPLLFLAASSTARADAGWPALMVFAISANAVKRFWFVVVLSLAIEAWFLVRYTKLSWKHAIPASLAANALTVVLGLGLVFALAPLDALVMKADYKLVDMFANAYFVFLFVLSFVITVLAESWVVSRIWHRPFKRAMLCLWPANAVTYGLGVAAAFWMEKK